jgi:KaiC/GvpD/RAD55 family RecA-like ATPase
MHQVLGKTSKDEPVSAQGPRAPGGIPGLDEVLGGGFPQGRIILVIGEPGAGKTVLASQFLINGVERFGENGVFVSLKESRIYYEREMNQFGWDFASAEKQGKFAFIDACPIREVPGQVKIGQLTIGRQDFSLISFLELIRKNAKAIGARRIVVDSLSMLELQYPDADQRRKAILDIVEALSETGATCVLTTDFASIGLEPFIVLENFLRFSIIQFEKQLFHGVISMQTIAAGRTMERIITVEKMRETQIDRQPRPYRITEKGIEVYPRESVI